MYSQRIYVDGAQFKVDEKQIFLNGSNTPWIAWNDFGIGRFKYADWDAAFQDLENYGVNSTRVWISCNGEKNPLQISPDGYVSGPSLAFLDDLDKLVEIATKHKVYLMAALISFDHTIEGRPFADRWRKMYGKKENMDSFVENYAVTIAKRYNNNPYFFAFDVCNEIMWVSESEKNDRGNYPWSTLQYLVGKTAQRVHEESEILVCVSNYLKYTGPGYQGNKWSDSALQVQVEDEDAYLDFYKIHYYSWVHKWFGGFHFDYSPDSLGIGEKPCITGEIPAKGGYDGNNKIVYSTSQYYEKHLETGWSGCMPWTSNGVDINGDIFGPHGVATLAFSENHPELVYPLGIPCKILPAATNVEILNWEATGTQMLVKSDSAVFLSTDQEWLNAFINDTILTIEVEENPGEVARTGNVTLSGCGSKTIEVVQYYKGIPTEDNISIISFPDTVSPGDDITVSVDYAAVTKADKVRVDIFNNFTYWKWYAGSQLDISTPVGGSHEFVVSIPADIDEGDYKLFANIKNGSTDVISTSADITIFDETAVGIQEKNNAVFLSVFPNPVHDKTLNIKTNVKVQIVEIYSIHGRLVYKQELDNLGPIQIEIPEMRQGIYILKVNEVTEKLFVK